MTELLLAALIFAAVVSAVLGITAFIGGAATRRLRGRLESLAGEENAEASVSAIRARYLRQLSPFERRLEQLPGVEPLSHLAEQAGWAIPGYRIVALSLALALAGAAVAVLLTAHAVPGAIAGIVAGALPWLKALQDRAARLDAIETQLPDALDLMERSLLAGNPLMESFKFVSEEMKPPIAEDFGRAWSNVNYGVSLKAALADLLQRTPSMSLRSLVTAILVQRETGGNMAEILKKISQVLRARVRFQRRLKTLTAEGRMSGWVLGGTPFGLAALMSITSPTYLPVLFHTETGQKMLVASGLLMLVGVFWISRVVKVRV
jgi:tight adherence protein B